MAAVAVFFVPIALGPLGAIFGGGGLPGLVADPVASQRIGTVQRVSDRHQDRPTQLLLDPLVGPAWQGGQFLGALQGAAEHLAGGHDLVPQPLPLGLLRVEQVGPQHQAPQDRWRSSRTSRSSAAIRALSWVGVPGRWPRSTSAWRTQERSDSVPMPSWRAARVITPNRSPDSSMACCTIRTARSRSSGG
jgi:hypothetical protein